MTTPIHDSDALEIEPRAVKELIDRDADFLLLDCRTVEEHDKARIDGAMLVPMQEMSMHVERLREHEDRLIVVYCHRGARSLKVTMALRQIGFEKVKSMTGGIHQWSIEIDPNVPLYTK